MFGKGAGGKLRGRLRGGIRNSGCNVRGKMVGDKWGEVLGISSKKTPAQNLHPGSTPAAPESDPEKGGGL